MVGLDFVSDLKPFKSMKKVRVKIYASGAVGKTIEIVLVDSKGDKILATVKKKQVSQFNLFLSQGLSKLMVNFSVMHSGGSYRTTNHPYRIMTAFKTDG
ncbi:hypothetical protein Bca4012_083071 [Brassica carinata]|uniref:Replication protein A 70 kDa DNA-binding subunit B/D first OB fold domain-containing protein n=1 Tax=Brassica carinata TaxID=52824 RepID=A0A8X7VB01_BRACI|nr:hypothetical protein Bca52824_027724 [Brassica carinata]